MAWTSLGAIVALRRSCLPYFQAKPGHDLSRPTFCKAQDFLERPLSDGVARTAPGAIMTAAAAAAILLCVDPPRHIPPSRPLI